MLEEYIGSIASLVGSLTVVGSAMLWIYNKFIGAPREKRRIQEENLRQKRMLEVVTRENEPLNQSIKQLTEWLNESKTDREHLNKMSKEHTEDIETHEKRLDNHQKRLIVLETLNKIEKNIHELSYQGGE